jgi:type IV pilus assembly protein PilF
MQKAYRIIFVFVFTLIITSCVTNNNSITREQIKLAAKYNTELGLIYLRAKQMLLAREKLLTARQQDPHSPITSMALAYYFEQNNDNKLAEYFYHNALKLSPANGGVLNNYGVFLCRQGNYQDGKYYLNLAAKQFDYLYAGMAARNANLCQNSKNLFTSMHQ